jgi:endo-1,4-beta-xylanase
MTSPHLTRRAFAGGLIASAPLVSACEQSVAGPQITALKDKAPFPIGNIASAAQLKDPEWAGLIVRHFDRLTPEWQMKPEYILQADGSLRFDAPDAIVAFARAHGLGVFGHVLVWYAQDKVGPFETLKGDKARFSRVFDTYVTGVASHYRGKLAGWDVVNEAIDDEGILRPCRFTEALGPDYIRRAFDVAHAADPDAPLFINDYNLEYSPKKRTALLRLVEGLLKAGAPVHGIGTQTHIAANMQPGLLKASIADIASLGLKVHVSEVDISLTEASKNPLDYPGLRPKQSALYAELAEAVMALPPEQRFGMTFWGLRDKDSWKNTQGKPLVRDEPCLFDDQGRMKPAAEGLIALF